MDGSVIREERKEKGLSQSKLSNLIDASQPQISRWELNKDEIPKNKLNDILNTIRSLTEKEIKKINDKKKQESTAKRSYDYPKSKSEKCIRDCDTEPDLPEYDLLNENARKIENGPKAVALFAGCGGFTLGFKLSGYKVEGYVEKEDHFREIYESNFNDVDLLGKDIQSLKSNRVKSWSSDLGSIDIVFGGPPCQGFSLAGKRNEDDPRNQLFRDYARVVEILQPKVILMENVRLLTSMDAPDGRGVVDHIKQALRESGYMADFAELNAKHFGVPQSRERVFFIGIREDLGVKDIEFPERTHGSAESLFTQELSRIRTFAEATSDLESLESGERSDCDPWHFAVSHPPHVIRWLKNVPEGHSAHENDDPDLRPNSGYNTTYKRIKSNEPCSTIGTNFGMISGSRNVHPEDTRSFTVREAMRVQTFPDDFKIFGRLTDVRDVIGNAVPPLLARIFGEHILNTYLSNF